MRRLLLSLTAAALVAGILGVPGAAREADAPRVILISIDGLMPSAYTDPALAEYTPNLRALKAQGVWADGVIGVLPTVTYPSHTTLITGVDPARPVVTSCGSGVSAALINLALFELGARNSALYDGSWAEWGAQADTPIAT